MISNPNPEHGPLWVERNPAWPHDGPAAFLCWLGYRLWLDAEQADPTEANAEILLDAMASHIRYRMAGDRVGDHTLTRDLDGVVWLDGERLCTWNVSTPACCRFHDGKTAEVFCHYCGHSDCPHADACVNTCAPTS